MAPSPPEHLPADHCHLWLVPVDDALAGGEERLRRWLSDAERAAIDRYRFPRHRREHLVSRAALRAALSRYGGEAPESFAFVLGPHGKPELPAHPLAFNVSNTETLVVVGVAAVEALGVDVEPASLEDEPLSLSAGVFSPAEQASLRGAPDPVAAFLTLWTMKEAYLKARGLGLGANTQAFTVLPTEGRVYYDAAAAAGDFGDDPTAWRLHAVTGEPGYHLAVAARHPRPLTVEVRRGLPLSAPG